MARVRTRKGLAAVRTPTLRDWCALVLACVALFVHPAHNTRESWAFFFLAVAVLFLVGGRSQK